jgi:hypothetical protein
VFICIIDTHMCFIKILAYFILIKLGTLTFSLPEDGSKNILKCSLAKRSSRMYHTLSEQTNEIRALCVQL